MHHHTIFSILSSSFRRKTFTFAISLFPWNVHMFRPHILLQRGTTHSRPKRIHRNRRADIGAVSIWWRFGFFCSYSVTIYYYYGLQRLPSSLCHRSIIMFDILIVLLKRSGATSWINVNHVEHTKAQQLTTFFCCHRIGLECERSFNHSTGPYIRNWFNILSVYALIPFFKLLQIAAATVLKAATANCCSVTAAWA